MKALSFEIFLNLDYKKVVNKILNEKICSCFIFCVNLTPVELTHLAFYSFLYQSNSCVFVLFH